MEYSVEQLILKLLKRWYVILITMLLVVGLSLYASQASYKNAVAQYEALTTETVPVIVETGTTTAKYEITYIPKQAVLEVLGILQTISENTLKLPTEHEIGKEAFAAIQQKLMSNLTNGALMESVQSRIGALGLAEPPTINADKVVTPSAGQLVVANHFSVEQLQPGKFEICVRGLEASIAQQIIDIYCEELLLLGDSVLIALSAEQLSVEFIDDPVQPTSKAIFAQTVMQKPLAFPDLGKTVGTAAVFAFVFACFGILLHTFITDGRKQMQKDIPYEE